MDVVSLGGQSGQRGRMGFHQVQEGAELIADSPGILPWTWSIQRPS